METHGILIDFDSKSGKHYNATYLPDVALEQGWDKLEALQSLVRKAGFRGGCDESLLNAMQVTRYQSSKASLTYKEYCEYRTGAE